MLPTGDPEPLAPRPTRSAPEDRGARLASAAGARGVRWRSSTGRSRPTGSRCTWPSRARDRWSCCSTGSPSRGTRGATSWTRWPPPGTTPWRPTCGATAAPTAPADPAVYTHLHLAGDVVGLLNALGEGPAVVVGHDWGAPLAWNTALFRPDLVRGVAGLSVPVRPAGRRRRAHDDERAPRREQLPGLLPAPGRRRGRAGGRSRAVPAPLRVRHLRRQPRSDRPLVPGGLGLRRQPARPGRAAGVVHGRGPGVLHGRVHPHRVPRRPQLVPGVAGQPRAAGPVPRRAADRAGAVRRRRARSSSSTGPACAT